MESHNQSKSLLSCGTGVFVGAWSWTLGRTPSVGALRSTVLEAMWPAASNEKRLSWKLEVQRMSSERIDFEVESDDEFGGDYDEPGSLRPEDVSGTVVYTLDWTVKTVVDQIDADPEDPDYTGVLVTSPPFQRRTAWDAERQSRFIESLMLGLPVPPLVLAESLRSEGQFYVLDGKQRLTSLRRFLSDPDNPLRANSA